MNVKQKIAVEMKQSTFAESPIDHHIQRNILLQLFESTSPVAFSDLKPNDVDNSLFMYHIRKLKDRGLITKGEQGYELTPDGARRVNFVSGDTLKPDLHPRALVSFLVFNGDESQLLLSRRTTHAADHLGEYVLPAGRRKYGVSLRECATARAQFLFGGTPTIKLLGNYETILTNSDGYVHHTAVCVYTLKLDQQELLQDEPHYVLEWVPVSDVLQAKYGNVLQKILQHYTTAQSFDSVTFSLSV